MDKLETYRSIIKRIVEHHAQYKPSHGCIEPMALCDTVDDQYLLIDVGWDNTGRVHAVVFHLHIRDGKIWIEWDGTEQSIAQELLDAGVPKEDIVLAFYRPEKRSVIDLAMA